MRYLSLFTACAVLGLANPSSAEDIRSANVNNLVGLPPHAIPIQHALEFLGHRLRNAEYHVMLRNRNIEPGLLYFINRLNNHWTLQYEFHVHDEIMHTRTARALPVRTLPFLQREVEIGGTIPPVPFPDPTGNTYGNMHVFDLAPEARVLHEETQTGGITNIYDHEVVGFAPDPMLRAIGHRNTVGTIRLTHIHRVQLLPVTTVYVLELTRTMLPGVDTSYFFDVFEENGVPNIRWYSYNRNTHTWVEGARAVFQVVNHDRELRVRSSPNAKGLTKITLPSKTPAGGTEVK